jgi:Tfp pilus assembly protein PilF
MQEVLELAPDNAGMFNFNGQICLIMGRWEEAEGSFLRAIELAPLLTDAHNNLGVVYSELGRDEDAEREFMIALGDPTYPTPEKVHMNLGMLYISQGRDDLALEMLRNSVEENPRYLRAHYELAGLLDRIGRLDEAASEYEVAKPDYRESGEFHYRLGWVYVRLGNTSRAYEHLRRVIDLTPGSNYAAQAAEILKTLE